MPFQPLHKHGNADALRRFPTESVNVEEPVPTELVKLLEATDTLPITVKSVNE